MSAGAMRAFAAWAMLGGAALVIAGALWMGSAVEGFDRQLQDLDPSEARAQGSIATARFGVVLAGAGVAVFLLAAIVLGLSALRARRHAAGAAATHARIAASVSTVLVVLAFAWGLGPTGPLAYATAAFSGGGGTAGATQVETFEGNLTGTAFSPTPPENVHAVDPVSQRGSMQLRVGSGGQGVSADALAILEAAQSDGSWREVARAQGPDGRAEVPVADYFGDLRIRVTLASGSVAQVRYIVGLSFTPE